MENSIPTGYITKKSKEKPNFEKMDGRRNKNKGSTKVLLSLWAIQGDIHVLKRHHSREFYQGMIFFRRDHKLQYNCNVFSLNNLNIKFLNSRFKEKKKKSSVERKQKPTSDVRRRLKKKNFPLTKSLLYSTLKNNRFYFFFIHIFKLLH